MQHVGLLHEKEITANYGDKARYLFHEVRIFASPLLCPSLYPCCAPRVPFYFAQIWIVTTCWCRLQFDSEQNNAISLEELWMAFEKQNKEGDLWIESAAV